MTKYHEQGRTVTNMGVNKSLISTREAAEESGFSARHIQKLIKTGKLSAEKDEGGNYLINKAEFYRVFPDAHVRAQPRTHAHNDSGSSRTVLESEVRHLQEMLAEKNKQNEFLHKQLEAATTEKTILLDTLISNQKLLEHHSGKKKRRRFLGLF